MADRRPGVADRRPEIPRTGGMDAPSGPERRVLTVGLLFFGPGMRSFGAQKCALFGPKKSAALFFRRRILRGKSRGFRRVWGTNFCGDGSELQTDCLDEEIG